MDCPAQSFLAVQRLDTHGHAMRRVDWHCCAAHRLDKHRQAAEIQKSVGFDLETHKLS